jgi:cysteine desulfurase / selenocysteine lyase
MESRVVVVIAVLFVLVAVHLEIGDSYISTTQITAKARTFHTTLGATGTEAIAREDFPILFSDIYEGKKLIFLDSAASSQKPKYVLEEMDSYYKTSHANVHRGAHALAVKATEKYEAARESVRKFVNAGGRSEIIFTRGATAAINLVAMSLSQTLKEGDEIILSVMEHHSNLVPWQMAAQRTGAVLKFVKLTDSMEFDLEHFYSLLSDRTKIVSIAHASNVLGTVNPVREVIKAAHEKGALVMLDACQSVPHMPIDVKELDVDFLAASGHKMCGPTGIGFLYGRKALLNSMPPVEGGGEMIDRVELHQSTYAQSPSRFEAGTPPIAEAVGLGAACEYLSKIGMRQVYEHEVALGKYLYEQLATIDDLILYGARAWWLSQARRCTPPIYRSSSTRREWRCARGITALNRCTPF